MRLAYGYDQYVKAPQPNPTVDESFFEPAWRLVRDYCRHRRDTLDLTDEQFLRYGIERVLGQCDSGRDFLQARQDRGEQLARSTWFDALRSKRRGAMGSEVARRSYEIFTRYLAQRDWLGAFPELKDRAVWAIDGHQVAHAAHARRDGKDDVFKNKLLQQKAWATGPTAAHTQVHRIALTHNLLTILPYHLD